MQIGKFYKNVALIFSGNIASHLIAILSLPVLTRIFTPDDFGVYQLFMSFCSVVAIMVTGQYELSIIAPKYNYVAFTLATATVFISTAISIVMMSVLTVYIYMADGQLGFFQSMYFNGISLWLGLYTLAICLYQVCYMWFVRQAQYKRTVTANVINAIGCVGLPLFIFYIGVDYGLIKGMAIAKILAIGYLCYNAKGVIIKYYKIINMRCIFRVLRRYNAFVKYALPGNVFNNIAAQVPSFLLNYFYGVTVTGYYSMANRCISLPTALAARSVGDVFKQEASYNYQQKGDCLSIYSKVSSLLVKGSIVYAVLVLALAPVVFSVVLGSQWQEAGKYAQLLVLAGATSWVYSPLSSIYVLTVKVREYMILQIISLSLIVTVFVLSGRFLSVEYTLLLYSLAISVVQIAGVIYGRRIAKRA